MPDAGRDIIDRAVAVVDGRVITQSELEFEARVVLVQAGGVRAATAPLDDQALADALRLSIGQRLEEAEADKLQAWPVDEAEVDRALTAFKARFASPAELQRFLDRHEADASQLAAVIARGLRAAKILDSKLKLRAQVSEAEVRRFYDAHRAELGTASFEDVRASIRQKLTADRLRQLTQAELDQLRKGAVIRLIAPYARAAFSRTPDPVRSP